MQGLAGADASGADEAKDIILLGVCKNTTDLAYAATGLLYAPETVGEPTTTIPADQGDFVRLVGWVLAADTIYFAPSAYHIKVP